MRRVPVPGLVALMLLAACAGEPERPRPATDRAMLEPRPDWSTGLPQLLPGIRACLREGGGAIGVTKAWPIGLSLVGARLLRTGGERTDCVAAEDGGRVFLTERVPEASRLPGERDPLFTPADLRPPGDACTEAAAVTGGWLSYDVCRDPRPVGPAASRQVPRPPSPALPEEG